MNDRVMQFRVGLMVVATLLIAGILVAMFGELPALVRGTYTIRIWFPQAPGVSVDTPVRKSGILIGRVTEVTFAYDITDEEEAQRIMTLQKINDRNEFERGVVITAEIHEGRRIYRNEICRVKVSFMGMGDSVLQVLPDTSMQSPRDESGESPAGPQGSQGPAGLAGQSGEVSDGQFLRGEAVADLQKEMIESFENVGSATKSMEKTVLAVQKFFDDNKDGLDSVVTHAGPALEAIKQAGPALEAIEQAANNVNELIGDKETQARFMRPFDEAPEVFAKMKDTMDSLELTLRNIDEIAAILGRSGPEAIAKFNALMTEMEDLTRQLNNNQGTLGRLVTDPEIYDQLNLAMRNINELVRQMKPVVADARVISDKVARHPGILLRDAVRPGPGIK